MGDVRIRAIFFLAVLSASLAIAVTPARAEPVPSNLVGLTKSLLNDIDPEDFKDLDDKIAGRVNKMLRQTRMRSWASTPTKIAVDRATLAAPLGLDPKNTDHLKALDAILAAENKQQRRKAFAQALEIARNKVPARAEIEQVEKQFNKVLRDKIGNKKTSATIEVDGDDGGLVKVSWDPETSSFITRLSFKDGTGDVYLTGSATAEFTNEGLTVKVKADEKPVTLLDDARKKKLMASIFGAWREGEDTWIIRGDGDGKILPSGSGPQAEEAEKAARQIGRLRDRIAEVRKQKIYIWRHPEDGEIIQKKYKRLPEPYEYDSEASKQFIAEKIKPLEKRIRDLEKEIANLPPVVSYDPLGLNSSENRSKIQQTIQIEVIRPDGYRYIYDTAQFDGERITARRTLRDVRDATELPDWVISSVIASFSPPEWIELKVDFDVREKQIRLVGKRWRLKVTYSPRERTVESIHTPYDVPLSLMYEGEAEQEKEPDFRIEFVAAEAPYEVIDDLVIGTEFRVNLVFEKVPGQGSKPVSVVNQRNGQNIELAAEPTIDPKVFQTRIVNIIEEVSQ